MSKCKGWRARGTGTLKVNAYAKGAECDVGIEILGIGAFRTPLVRKMDEGTYTVKCSNQTKAVKIRVNETTEVVLQLDSQTLVRALWREK